jgi:hypothetical protein
MTFTRFLLVCSALMVVLSCSPQADPVAVDKTVSAEAATEPDTECVVDPPGELRMCTADWTPVCGCDGKTYSNACNAKAAGVSAFTAGECGKNDAL